MSGGKPYVTLFFFPQFFLIIYPVPLWTFRFPDFRLTQKCLSTLRSCLQHLTRWISPKTTICFLFHKALSRLSALNFPPFIPHLQASCQAMRLSSPFHSWKLQLLFSRSRLIRPPVLCSHCLTLQVEPESPASSFHFSVFSLEFSFSSAPLAYKQAQVVPKLRNKKMHFKKLASWISPHA